MKLPVKKIAIQDANILIDLVNVGLFSHCLALQFHFCTTELIFAELNERQRFMIQPQIDSGKFEVISISVVQLFEIQLLSSRNRKLSEQDWSAVYFAEKLSALLLSGDKMLRKAADGMSIEVRGIIWLLDQLLQLNIITEKEACTFLNQLLKQNQRLPPEECRKRIELWCKG